MLTFSRHLLEADAVRSFDRPHGMDNLWVRKNESELTDEEKRIFKSAIRQAVASGLYSRIVWDHAEIGHRHHSVARPVQSQRFLPWYRAYLLKFESTMRAFEPRFSIPFWDWTACGSVPNWLAPFTLRGIRDLNGHEILITRARRPRLDLAVRRGTLGRLMAHTNYLSFTRDLESVHNRVHAWTGGTMDDVLYSPADPLFWLHQAQCDRIWWSWERCFPEQVPGLQGTDQILDPWLERATDVTRDKLNYVYTSMVSGDGTGAA